MKPFASAVVVCALMCAGARGQMQLDLRNQARNVDFTQFPYTKPFKTDVFMPSTCTTGDTFFKTNAPPGMNLYVCTATNTWTLLGDGNTSMPDMTGNAMRVLSNNGVSADWRALGGDVAGSPESLNVRGIHGRNITMAVPADRQIMRWNQSTAIWELVPDAAHAHAITDISGVSGKQGNTGILQSFGGGIPGAGDCAEFDGNGNIVSAGVPCQPAAAPNYSQLFTSITSIALAHNLNTTNVIVRCYDSADMALEFDTLMINDAMSATVTFAVPQSGRCVVNASGGGGGGGGGPTYTAGSGVSLAGNTVSVDTTTVPTYATASASLDFNSIPQNTCSELMFPFTDAMVGDSVAPGWPATLEAGLVGSMYVSASGHIGIRLCNVTSGTTDPVNQTFRATIVRSF